jgi:Domain of unknown function (DUF222)
MSSTQVSDRETILAAYDELDAAFDKILGFASYAAMTHSEKVTLQHRMERNLRRVPTVGHRLIGELAAEASPTELGGTSLADVLATALRISKKEARRRIKHAELFGPRRALSGEELAPQLPKTAAAQERGQIGVEHVRVIERFFDQLPVNIDYQAREHAEAQLAHIAAGLKPEELRPPSSCPPH